MIRYDDPLIKDINAPRVKHVALTKYLRNNWGRNPYSLKRLVYNCDVSPYLGALPPQLRARVSKSQIADVTAQFRDKLEDFLIANAPEIRSMDCDRVYDIPEIANLFGTKCQLVARGINVYGVNPWAGLLGFVCKLSFPDINAHYALKLFFDDTQILSTDHGPWFEVATALAAGKAEPRDNNKLHMASWRYEMYMLSDWAGDVEDGQSPRKNQNQIFWTAPDENESRNLRAGQRIDWGETYRTDYGALSYPARKLYRQIQNYDIGAINKARKNIRNSIQRKDFNRATELVALQAWYDDNEQLAGFVEKIKLR